MVGFERVEDVFRVIDTVRQMLFFLQAIILQVRAIIDLSGETLRRFTSR